MIIFWNKLTVQRATNGQAAAIEDVSIDHGGGDIFVPKQILDGADIVAGFKQMGGKAVAKGMATDRFGEVGGLGGASDRFLQATGVNMVAVGEACAGVGGVFSRRKDVLPDPLAVGMGIFAVQGRGQVDRAVTFGQVVKMP